jgi:hypothetical protein
MYIDTQPVTGIFCPGIYIMQLAYLIAEAVDDNSWSGGLLITDDHGLPLDFRYVEPIRPTRLQKLIYGESLKRSLMLDAIAGTLLKATNFKSEWIFTNDPVLLELDGKTSGKVVSISNGEKDPLTEVGEWRFDKVGEGALQVSPTGPPVKLHFDAKEKIDTDKIAEDLAWLASQFDFTEPLKRVQSALKEICSNPME